MTLTNCTGKKHKKKQTIKKTFIFDSKLGLDLYASKYGMRKRI